jgi:predicted RNA binding protein YcfA (HicA-like mRNA interferase family)
MKRWRKVLARMRAVGGVTAFSDLESVLRGAGYRLKRQKGSHAIWSHDSAQLRMNVQRGPGATAKSYQVDQLLEQIELLESRGLLPD